MENSALKHSRPEEVRAGRGQQAAPASGSAAPEAAFRGLSQRRPAVIRIGVAKAPSRWLKPGGR
jgi:hypothetical protein